MIESICADSAREPHRIRLCGASGTAACRLGDICHRPASSGRARPVAWAIILSLAITPQIALLFFKKVLTNGQGHAIISSLPGKHSVCWCGSMAEQLICNQQVDGSTPFTSSNESAFRTQMGDFPSGQRGQTVNLLSLTSVVRIHLPPPKKTVILIQNYSLF